MTNHDPYAPLEDAGGPSGLKPLGPEALPRALERADRYRLLNEPREAESICLDILRCDSDNQKALATLLLAITDQFARPAGADIARARALVPRFRDAHDRAYYSGVVSERWGKARLQKGDAPHVARAWFEDAMSSYEKAEKVRPPGNDDSILRWNACARILARDERLRPRPGDLEEPETVIEDEEAPQR
jgi:hypothetical protein